MLRPVALPSGVAGELYLDAMPGRREPWASSRAAISGQGIGRVVSLASLDEIRKKSHCYAKAIESKDLPWEQAFFPVPDFSVPKDRAAFLDLVGSIAGGLQAGERVVIHCGAGIGRTGTLAVCVLMALGMSQSEAYRAVRGAGSHPETPEQEDLVDWVAIQLAA